MNGAPQCLLAHLAQLPDPRRAQGRRYPLAALLGLVILGALHGQSSLRGIWVWAEQHWTDVWPALGFRHARFPALTTLWNVSTQVDHRAVERVLTTWLTQLARPPLEGISADGKVLRGSRRDEAVGLHLVSIVQHYRGVVLGQARVTGGDGELGALLELLQTVPLQGRVLTLDAGLLQHGVTRVVPRHGGAYLGVVKQNHREIKAAIDSWLVAQGVAIALAERRAADITTIEKNRGRVEERSVWLAEAGELGDYLAREYGWWHVQQVGWLRRSQQRRPHLPWQTQEVTLVTSLSRQQAGPRAILQLLRDHWVIENKVHRVRDVSYREDQGHGRKSGQLLAWARNVALSVMRMHGIRYIPDGWRFGSAHPDRVLMWLTDVP
ncbi:MAG: ISAs1 family transposase [Chloroflexota bacterium]|nr:ISAs1 family transposase [Chloroflexota bacterium]